MFQTILTGFKMFSKAYQKNQNFVLAYSSINIFSLLFSLHATEHYLVSVRFILAK